MPLRESEDAGQRRLWLGNSWKGCADRRTGEPGHACHRATSSWLPRCTASLSCLLEVHGVNACTQRSTSCGVCIIHLPLPPQVAIKFIERREVVRNQKSIRREIVNHSALLHPHIIQFRRYSTPGLVLVQPGSALWSLMRPVPELGACVCSTHGPYSCLISPQVCGDRGEWLCAAQLC